MEALNPMMEVAVARGFLSGFSVGNANDGLITLLHLLFSDDTLIFCDADHEQIQALRAVLLYFEAVSGLKVFLGKLEMIPVGEVRHISCLAALLGCKLFPCL